MRELTGILTEIAPPWVHKSIANKFPLNYSHPARSRWWIRVAAAAQLEETAERRALEVAARAVEDARLTAEAAAAAKAAAAAAADAAS